MFFFYRVDAKRIFNEYGRRILGLQISQKSNGIFISQAKYAREIVKKFGLDSSRHPRTPMSTTTKLGKDTQGKEVDTKLYRSMIGSLLYLTASRPDIAFSVCVCARYQAAPKESHLIAVKRIIRYVNSIVEYGIWYDFDTNPEIAGYSDADWAGDVDDRKFTYCRCFNVGNNLIAWHSKKKIPSLCLPPKLNILQLVVVVQNFFG